LCGEGADFKELQSRILGLGLQESITLHGWVGPVDVKNLLRRAEIFVLPSHYEGMPMSMLEAMAANAAVVVTPVGVIPDFVKDGEHALLVPPKSPDNLAIALEKLVRDPALRERLQVGGRKLVEDIFDIPNAQRSLEEAVSRLMSVGRKRRKLA
jgi:glycosyltransferase involved in cell wall biosynthesis